MENSFCFKLPRSFNSLTRWVVTSLRLILSLETSPVSSLRNNDVDLTLFGDERMKGFICQEFLNFCYNFLSGKVFWLKENLESFLITPIDVSRAEKEEREKEDMSM